MDIISDGFKYKRVTLTKEDIIPFRDSLQIEVPDRHFDKDFCSKLLDVPDNCDMIRGVIKKYQQKYTESLELLGICELALLYLEEKEKK